jgi:hypothetical protein
VCAAVSDFAAILTTIQPPTAQVHDLLARLAPLNAPLYVAGDSKGPASFDVAGAVFLSLADQKNTAWRLAALLGERHYARKNIAYLTAVAAGARRLYETDDDTAPAGGWAPRTPTLKAERAEAEEWANAYRLFSTDLCWPRGFPLDAIHAPVTRGPARTVWAPIQQGLIDGNTDVDAIWRLLWSHDIAFDSAASPVYLPPSLWCPFNSQSTWWWEEAFPLLYLPFNCSFRMTDIWRGFVAQRCLWAMDAALVFTPPDSFQVRNPHDLMVDFAQEVPGYLGNRKLVAVLKDLPLEPGPQAAGPNLIACYRALVAAEFFPDKELALVEAFVADMRDALSRSAR